jgi:outer membrane receptor protein involved in Fe transport
MFIPTGFSLTSSLPWHRANFSLFYDGPADSWLAGFDAGAVVHFIGQYEDDNFELVGGPHPTQPRIGPDGITGQFARKVRESFTADLIASYTFNLPAPVAQEVAGYAKDGGKSIKMKDGKDKNVMPVSTAEYNPCGWRAWLNGTSLTFGMQNITDEDPPFVAGNFENGYDESITTIKGRFYYVELKKRF